MHENRLRLIGRRVAGGHHRRPNFGGLACEESIAHEPGRRLNRFVMPTRPFTNIALSNDYFDIQQAAKPLYEFNVRNRLIWRPEFVIKVRDEQTPLP